jgi:hypothetical protein
MLSTTVIVVKCNDGTIPFVLKLSFFIICIISPARNHMFSLASHCCAGKLMKMMTGRRMTSCSISLILPCCVCVCVLMHEPGQLRTETSYWLGNQSDFHLGQGFLHYVQTSIGTHPVSSPLSTKSSFLGDKAVGA